MSSECNTHQAVEEWPQELSQDSVVKLPEHTCGNVSYDFVDVSIIGI